MKILKPSGDYLKRKAKTNVNISIILFVAGIVGLLFSFISINFGLISLFFIIVVIGGIMLVIGMIFFNRYLNYRSGLEAENLVTYILSYLDDRYYLINDIRLPDSYGNIDHVLLGPNGVFVIETKNYGGQIICYGDEWIRHYEGGLAISMKGRLYWKPDRDYDVGSPSRQAKRNAVKIRQLIESSRIFEKPLNIWIEGIVVFTNPQVDLRLANITVPVFKIDQLYNYIKNRKSRFIFSSQELELIGNAILRGAKAD